VIVMFAARLAAGVLPHPLGPRHRGAHPVGEAGGRVLLGRLDELVRFERIAVRHERARHVGVGDERVRHRKRLVSIRQHGGDRRGQLRRVSGGAPLGFGGVRDVLVARPAGVCFDVRDASSTSPASASTASISLPAKIASSQQLPYPTIRQRPCELRRRSGRRSSRGRC
jgi:hypothetical protein